MGDTAEKQPGQGTLQAPRGNASLTERAAEQLLATFLPDDLEGGALFQEHCSLFLSPKEGDGEAVPGLRA